MCLLIVLRGLHAEHPLVVAGNRDERRDRPAAPPGLWLGQRQRVISPRDRRAGGTWLGINDRGMLAGLTNIAGCPPVAGAPSRGELPHLALDAGGIDAAVAAVRAIIALRAWSAFQLVVADAQRLVVLRHEAGALAVLEWHEPLLVVSNEHAPGQLELPGLRAAVTGDATAAQRLDRLRPLLLDRGGDGRHPVLKTGAEYGTVSSSLLAVPARDVTDLIWHYAAGSPDQAPYRNYGNLGRRLLPDAP